MKKLRIARKLLTQLADFFAHALNILRGQHDVSQAQLDIDIEKLRREILSADARLGDSRSLNHFEFKVYSQDGSDGILHELLRRVGEGSRTFVEFGSGTGLENNTAFLVSLGWSGLWIDGDQELVRGASAHFEEAVSTGRLTIVREFLTRENVEQLFSEYEVPHEATLVSIDIDGNDYWVWDAIRNFRPRIIAIEYNAMFPPDVSWAMSYNPEHVWRGDSYQGASLKSLASLGAKKGYTLVGCSLAGINSFFVRSDLLEENSSLFSGPFVPEQFYHPPRYFMIRESAGHPRSYGPFEAV